MSGSLDFEQLWSAGSPVTRRHLLQLALAGAAGAAVASTGSRFSMAQTPAATPFGEPQVKGGTAVIAALGIGNPRIFVPTSYYGTDAYYVSKLVYTPLLNLDRTWENLGPALAESYTQNPDGTEITLKLRKDVVFHDGQSFTSKDVVFTYKLACRTDANFAIPDSAILAGGQEYKDGKSEDLPGVVAVDDYTVKFTLTSPSNVILRNISNCGILPAHKFDAAIPAAGTLIQDLPFFAWDKEPPIGTGPWKITEYDPQSNLTFAAHEQYFRGRPILDGLTLRIGLQGPAVIAGIQAGEFDSAYVNGESAKSLESDQSLALNSNYSMANENVLITATEKDYLSVPIRQALLTALDIPTLIDTVAYGYAKPAPSIMMFPDLFPNEKLPAYTFDPEKAKQLLAEGGWDSSRTLKFGQFVADAAPNNVVAAIMSMWRDIGINSEFTPLDPANQAKISKSADHPYDLVLTNFAWLAYDPSSSYASFATSRQPNYSNYTNPEYDKVMEQAIRTPTLAEAIPLYQQAQVMLQTDLPYAPAWILPEIWAVNKRFHGGVLGRGPLNNIESEKWWKES